MKEVDNGQNDLFPARKCDEQLNFSDFYWLPNVSFN
jgi:hypothetical protein